MLPRAVAVLVVAAGQAVVEAKLCYDQGKSEYIVHHGTRCTGAKLKGLNQGRSRSECQNLCHLSKTCGGFEWVTFRDEAPLKTPECVYYGSDIATEKGEDGVCFVKANAGAYKFCAKGGGQCQCGTEVRFGSGGEWVHTPLTKEVTMKCTPDAFGLEEEAFDVALEEMECQCAASTGLELLLIANNYVTGDEWEDESGHGHSAILSFGDEKPASTAPEFVPSFRSPSHFHFDGKDDYLSIKDMHFRTDKTLRAFTISVHFRTQYTSGSKFSNWALVDFDRSEFFNVYVQGDGVIGFSTRGQDGIDDMSGSVKVNDGGWHWVTVSYSITDGKAIFIDGVQDGENRKKHSTGVGSKLTRYGRIGEGSEAASQFGGGNGIYYDGDISGVEIYTSILDPKDLKKGLPTGLAISDQLSCYQVPNDKCTWVTNGQEETYYFEGYNEGNAAVVAHVAGGDETVVFPDVSLVEVPENTASLKAVIESGCNERSDTLSLGLKTAEVEAKYEPRTCTLTLTATAAAPSSATWLKVIPSILFKTTSEDFRDRTVTWFPGDMIFYSETGHYYKYVDDKAMTWVDAKAKCTQAYNGLDGYLATLTSAGEGKVVGAYASGNNHFFGLTDEETEGEWKWATGPEAGQVLGYGQGTAFKSEGGFTNWEPKQPDDWSTGEDYGCILKDGSWNDCPPTHTNKISGCLCEYGGMGGVEAKLRHGVTVVEVAGCVLRPCNHGAKTHCLRERGCQWSEGSATCYPECEPHYYTELCDVYCKAEETCSGKGRCNSLGKCSCNRGWGGPTCEWPMHKCTAWGDPHYTNFEGEKFDFHGVPQPTNSYPGTYVVYERASYSIMAQHYRCSGTVKRPIGCMKQVKFMSGDWSLELNVAQEETELGTIHVKNTTGVSDIKALEAKLPMLIGNIALVKAVGYGKKRTDLTFELPNENDIHTRVRIVQSDSWKAPYMNVYVDHYGPTTEVEGLCSGSCIADSKRTGWGKDCTEAFANKFDCKGPKCDFRTVVEDKDIKFCQGLEIGKGGCTVDNEGCTNPAAETWAKSCCSHLRTCGGEENYQQCVVENCNMGWVGDAANSRCADAFESVLLENDMCGAEICKSNRHGPGCAECLPGFYGKDCTIECDAEITCNARGTCSPQGKCWCEKGYTASIKEEGLYCLHPCEVERTKQRCQRKRCRWISGEDQCIKACKRGFFGRECDRECDPKTTCSNHGVCTEEGRCRCKTGWSGEDCSKGRYTCSAWGDPHYTSFKGKRFDFFGPEHDLDGELTQYELYQKDTFHMTARHWKCNNRATCMKTMSIWDERGGSVEVSMDGTFRVNCTLYNKTQVAEMLKKGPWVVLNRGCVGPVDAAGDCTPQKPLKLTESKKTNLGHGQAPSFFFEVSEEGDVDLEIQIAARVRALDVYLSHYGGEPKSEGVSGLCLDKPGSGEPGTGLNCYTDDSSSCSKTSEAFQKYGHCRTGPPPCATVAKPKCWDGAENCGFCAGVTIKDEKITKWRCEVPAGKAEAEKCCLKVKSCKDTKAYDQCIWDECALGEDGKCLDNHGAALAFDDRSMEASCFCDSPNKAVDLETGECSSCKPGWYNARGKPCSRYCAAETTCNNHGSCDGAGYCWCDEGYTGDDCLGKEQKPPPSTACMDQPTVELCEKYGCVWDFEIACKRTVEEEEENQCWEFEDAEKCTKGKCFWLEPVGDVEGACLDMRPEVPEKAACDVEMGDCPEWFTAKKGVVKQPTCDYDWECENPKEGESVVVKVDGFPSKRKFPEECKAAAAAMLEEGSEGLEECQDGWVALTPKETQCDNLYEGMAPDAESVTSLHKAYYKDDATRVTAQFPHWDPEDESYFGYKICYIPKRPKDMSSQTFVPTTPAPRRCPGNYAFDLEGNCAACAEGWIGAKCDIACSGETTCHGHGKCDPLGTKTDQCLCSAGWEDEEDYEEEGFGYTLECFAPTAAMKADPEYKEYSPKAFTPTKADIRNRNDKQPSVSKDQNDKDEATGDDSHQEDCTWDEEYEECYAPVKDNEVNLRIEGVPGMDAAKGEVVGFASVVVKGEPCGRPHPEKVLMDNIKMVSTEKDGVLLSEATVLGFDPQEEDFDVCFRPLKSPLPSGAKASVATLPVSRAAAGRAGNDEEDSSNILPIVLGVVGGVIVLAVVSLAVYKFVSNRPTSTPSGPSDHEEIARLQDSIHESDVRELGPSVNSV